MPGYTSVAVFLFSAIALVVPSGFSLGAAMLCFHRMALAFLTHNNGVMTLAFTRAILWPLLRMSSTAPARTA